ncbi:MAG: damage-inducible protein DinB [Planctomycetes bacterium]|nr:damage-inducible protein DinB [Planctomycetota bacterium]
MAHDYLIETYATERIKVLGVWSMFRDEDLSWRPPDPLKRGRSVLEQMVHQCLSEDLWFKKMFGIELAASPLPAREDRSGFIRTYAAASEDRLKRLRAMPPAWWDEETAFFEVRRVRAWIMVRRLLHTSHHRGQLTAYLRALGRELHSTYGPTSDTGGLTALGATTVYAHESIEELLEAEANGKSKRPLPGPPQDKPYTERP